MDDRPSLSHCPLGEEPRNDVIVQALIASLTLAALAGCTLGGQVRDFPPVVIDSLGLTLDRHYLDVRFFQITKAAIRGLRALNFEVDTYEERPRAHRPACFISAHRDDASWVRLAIQELRFGDIEVSEELAPPDQLLAEEVQSEIGRELRKSRPPEEAR
jgi:hypothetical protein